MIPEQIAALRQLCEQATPGEWNATDGKVWIVEVTPFSVPECCGRPGDECCGEPVEGVDYEQTQTMVAESTPDDAAFIAAARTALPDLLDALGEKDKEIARLRQDIRNLEAALASKRFPA